MHKKNQIHVFQYKFEKNDVVEVMEKPQVKFFIITVALF